MGTIYSIWYLKTLNSLVSGRNVQSRFFRILSKIYTNNDKLSAIRNVSVILYVYKFDKCVSPMISMHSSVGLRTKHQSLPMRIYSNELAYLGVVRAVFHMPQIGDDHSSTRPNTGDIYPRTVTNLTTRMSRGRSGSKDSGNGLLSNSRPAYRSAGEGISSY